MRKADLCAHLRERIVRGAFGPGHRLPTRVEIERQFDASPVTVQRALDALAAEGFVQSRGGRGTFVMDHPPHLFRYGLVFPWQHDHQTPWPRFYHALREACESRAMAPRQIAPYFAARGHVDSEDFLTLRRDVLSHRVAGLIVLETACEAFELHEELREVPRVYISARPAHTPRVELDAAAWNARALDYLKKQRCTRVAVLCSSEIAQHSNQWLGFLGQVEKLGMRCMPEHVMGVDKHRPEWAANAMRMLMSSRTPPDGLLIMDDNLVEQAAAGLASAGVRVPQDLVPVVHCNFPARTPPALAAPRLGFAADGVLQTCLQRLVERKAGRQAAVVRVSPQFESELTSAADGGAWSA